MASKKGNTVSDMKNWTSRCEIENKAAASWSHRWGCVFDPNAKVGELGTAESTEETARCRKTRFPRSAAPSPRPLPPIPRNNSKHAAIATACCERSAVPEPARSALLAASSRVTARCACMLTCARFCAPFCSRPHFVVFIFCPQVKRLKDEMTTLLEEVEVGARQLVMVPMESHDILHKHDKKCNKDLMGANE